MDLDRRRSPRFQVTGIGGALHVTFTARLVGAEGDLIRVETSRPLRIGRCYAVAPNRRDDPAARRTGTVTSCRLTALRASSSGPAASVYEAELHADAEQRWSDLEAGGDGLTMTATHDAAVRVLSVTGALVETDLELLIGSSCRVELQLPGRPFDCRACVVFAHQIREGEPPAYHLGVEFHHPAPQDREALEAFVATLAG